MPVSKMSRKKPARKTQQTVAKAHDVMDEGWEQTTVRARIARAHKALAISP